jgi:type II secretory pathway component PulM
MQQPGWRHVLRRELTWLLALKAAALILLWWLFFSPAHRTPVDAAAALRRLAVTAVTPGAPAATRPRAEPGGG